MKNLYISMFGSPNAGKSTLINKLIDFNVCAVSHKAQTTREAVRAILTNGDTQLVFIDTPGVFQAKNKDDGELIKQARKGIKQSNFYILVIDGSNPSLQKATIDFLEMYSESNTQVCVIINKVDKKPEQALQHGSTISSYSCVDEIFYISAKQGKGTENLTEYLMSKAIEADWEYDEELITDRNENYLTAEMTREQIFKSLHDELPYEIEVETESIEQNDTFALIKQTISLNKNSQKKIIIGKNGEKIKLIAQKAATNMEDIFGKKVSLKIFVKKNNE